MATPLPKRRRLHEDPAAVLRKPFRSPLKTALSNQSANSKPLSESAINLSTPPREKSASNDTSNGAKEINRATSSLSPTKFSPRTPKPTQPHPTTLTNDPEIRSLERTAQSLQKNLSEIRTEIQTATQAAEIEASNKEAELLSLIAKWQRASREAAEEMYGRAKDQVNRMGGCAAWKANEREKRRKRDEWAREGEMEMRRAARVEMRRLRRGGGSGGESEDDGDEGDGEGDLDVEENFAEGDGDGEKADVEGDEGESYTMEMMLTSLNIDLDLVGWDKEAQRWKD